MAIERYRQYGFIRNLKRKLFYNNSLVKKNQDCRCLVVLHLFYEKSWIEINEYLKSLAPYSFDLIITATKNRISSETIEGAPYKYISEGDISGYERYCEFHKDNGLPLMTKERFDGLIESIDKDGYDERYISIIDDQNVLLDGQHRICILANKYGVESYIRVLKIWDIKRIVVRILVKLVRYKA